MRPSSLRMNCAIAAIALCLCACNGGSAPSQEGDARLSFPPPSAEELNSIQSEWVHRDLKAYDVELVTADTTSPNYEVRIYKHRVGNNMHYGAVTIPKNAQPGTVPVLLHADGLAQQDPSMDLDQNLKMAGELPNGVIYAVPTFRGRNLFYKGVSYAAGGNFCDAYDGAADDAIAFLNVVEQEITAANMDRVMVRGGSRGGTVALLLAMRDARIKGAIAVSAPVDFDRLEVRVRLDGQYQCQFIDGKTAEASRLKILASSPLYFPVLDTVLKIFIFHGSADAVVPVWNATEISERLQGQDVPVDLQIFEGYGHDDLGSSPEFRAAQRAAIGELFR